MNGDTDEPRGQPPGLRPARRFQPAGESAADDAPRGGRQFQQRQLLDSLEPDAAMEDGLDPSAAMLDPGFPRRPRRWLATLLLAVVILGGIQFGAWLLEAWRGGNPLAMAWSGLALIALSLGGSALLRELWWLRHLRRHMRLRDQAGDHWGSEAVGEAGSILAQRLRRDSGIPENDAGWQAFLAGDAPHHTDGERLQRYSRHLLAPRDRHAQAIVSRAASESALLVAVSPLVWVDMLLLAWRTLRMLERIAAVYGLRLGYASRLRLFRGLLLNMALTGASELAADAGADLLALGIAGRFSARLAQGLGAGLLTARLGFRAMALCRPLPFEAGQRPRLGQLRQVLLDDLQALMKKAPQESQPRRA